MMIKLFVSDLDNTLFTGEKTIRVEDRNAIRRLMDAGVEICLASGRMDKELVQVMRELSGSFHRISQNGAFVYTREDESLLSVHFEGDLARRLYEDALPYGLTGFISLEDRMLVPRITDGIRAFETRLMFPIEEDPTILKEIGQSIYPSKICLIGPIENIRRLERHVHDQYAGLVDTFISDRDCIDLMPPGISKGEGLRRLLDRLGIRPEETVTIGDSYNDISMLQATPHSFAMAHADEEVRRAARYTVNSVAEAAEWVLERNQSVSKQS
jgi:Cof subfamily protein (haloacid dehalogenase superfamily)